MKILIVELNKYHTETFPIHSNLLPAFFGEDDIEFHYMCHEDNARQLNDVYENTAPVVSNFIYFLVKNTGLRPWYFKRKIQGTIDRIIADAVVFNSIEPERNRKVFNAVKAKRKIAVIHNPKRFSLRKNDNEDFFVISKTVFEAFKDALPLSGYLLPFFKPYPSEPSVKNSGKTMIGIQGLIDFRRRDYNFLVKLAITLKKQGISNVLFNIIGANNKKGGKKLRDMIREDALSEYFRLHEKLVDKAFYSEIETCDLLMPLLGPLQESYLKEKTSATLSHAAAYSKPMLLSRSNAVAWELDEGNAFLYNDLESCAQLFKTDNPEGVHCSDIIQKKQKNFTQWAAAEITKNTEMLRNKPV